MTMADQPAEWERGGKKAIQIWEVQSLVGSTEKKNPQSHVKRGSSTKIWLG